MVDSPDYGLWGGPAPSGNPLDSNGRYNPPGNSTGNAPPASNDPAAAPAATPATGSAGDFSLDSLKLSADGHLWGEKRVISTDPANPGATRYQFVQVDLGDPSTPDGLAAISALTGIPAGAITAAMPGLQATLAQNARAGNGSIIGQNLDGSYSYYDRTGTIRTTSNPADLALAGIQQSAIQQAQTDRINGQRTLTQAGQYAIVGVNPNGTVSVRDYYGAVTSVPAAQAATMPGITAGQIQDAQIQAQTNAFQMQTVGQTLGFGLPGGAAPGPPPTPPPQPPPRPGDPGPPLPGQPSPTPGGRGGDAFAAAPPPAAATATPAYPPPPVNPAAAPAAPPPAYAAPPPYPTTGAQTPPAAPPTPTAPPASPGLATPPPYMNRSGTQATAATPTVQASPTTTGANPAMRLDAQYQAAAAAYGAQGGAGAPPPRAPAPPAPPPTATATGQNPNDWTTQQLGQINQTRQNYLNYGKAAQAQQTAALAGQSRSTQGTGFSSIAQRQQLAGQ